MKYLTRLDDFFLRQYMKLAQTWVRYTFTDSDRLLGFILVLNVLVHTCYTIAAHSISGIFLAGGILFLRSRCEHVRADTGVFIKLVSLLPVPIMVLDILLFSITIPFGTFHPSAILQFVGTVLYGMFVYALRTPNIDPPPRKVTTRVSSFV